MINLKELEPLPEIIKEKDIELTQEELHELFEYRDGDLYWKIRPSPNRVKIGDMAGYKHKPLKTSKSNRFMYNVRYKGKNYFASRIIFKMFHGWLPEVVQCIDGNCLNTKIENLRAVNRSQVQYSGKKPSNNSSGYKGVSSHKKRWQSTIRQQKKVICLGIFDTPEEAHKAYCEAAKKLHGEFANYG
jgi:hypothetical protein